MENDWKQRLGVVFSTNPDYQYTTDDEPQVQTLAPREQDLRVWRDTKGRAGKVATVVRGFVGSDDDLQQLGRLLKKRCGVGGAVKEGEIIIQGDVRDRVTEILLGEGYRCKKV